MRNRSRPCLFVAALCAAPAWAQQWEVVVLHPQGCRSSEVFAIQDGRQTGPCVTAVDPTNQAGYWTGGAGSWTAVGVPGVDSFSVALDGPRIAGSEDYRAVLWDMHTTAKIDLHPPPWPELINSAVYNSRNGLQVGLIGLYFGIYHAVMWRGSVETFTDLHPAGSYKSYAWATDGLLQGGSVQWTSSFTSTRAALWNGSRGTVIDLGPPGRISQIWAMAPGMQVGEVSALGGYRGAIWRGTPESFVELGPPGNSSRLYGTTGRVHAGRLGQNGLMRAAVNFGTPEAWVGLHQFLPARFASFSEARAVYQEGPTITVGGSAENEFGYNEAVLWIGQDPCYANCDGSTVAPALNIADFTCFLHSFAGGDPFANCDGSTTLPRLNVADFTCFLQRFAAGCP